MFVHKILFGFHSDGPMFRGQHLLPRQETAEGNVELCLGGAERLVTEENKMQYVETRTAVDEGKVKGRMG